MSELEEQIKVVAVARKLAEEQKNIVSALREEWEQENQTVLELADSSREGVKEVETILRELTLKAYAETGNKAPAVGVGIREVTKLDYDQKVAYNWAVEHSISLKLDVSAFEKIVKASPLDIVTISTEPQATIATNLEVE